MQNSVLPLFIKCYFCKTSLSQECSIEQCYCVFCISMDSLKQKRRHLLSIIIDITPDKIPINQRNVTPVKKDSVRKNKPRSDNIGFISMQNTFFRSNQVALNSMHKLPCTIKDPKLKYPLLVELNSMHKLHSTIKDPKLHTF